MAATLTSTTTEVTNYKTKVRHNQYRMEIYVQVKDNTTLALRTSGTDSSRSDFKITDIFMYQNAIHL
jgi:hypothetical protein